ncbi:uncharacterized protein LOC120131037 [Hibiscus syriacus]|uniref:uncharacterized protein LOC120131037 n=1 Tax=Hibiscus syriacus TaxID=106335 RepID=UPI001924C7B6|nr:uncharacterized protein LOC120131037 [Hibiscus syriacus]
MNVLSRLLDAAARIGIFKYHPRCKKISLTHLCFADDLMLFCYGSLDSVLGVVSVLNKFYEMSGLMLNVSKTEIYTCGVNNGVLEQIKRATGFRIGHLPVKYLGVPLVTRKLSRTDCSALIEKIRDKLRKWSCRKLSFGGRLQLIKTVLFSVFNYWSRQFILPKGVIQDIERLFMRFFWKGSDSSARGARSILADEGSLWIACIKAYCFKHKNYWSVDHKPHFSWILRKLIKLREEASVLFAAPVDWSQITGGWIWDRIRDRGEKVDWHRLVWFPSHVPKFSLIAWMAILDRLPTKDRLVRFGVMAEPGCRLCMSGLESRNHLFWDCAYSSAISNSLLLACGLQLHGSSWEDHLGWMINNWKCKSLLIHVLKLAWTGFVYFTWEERNHRIFRGLSRSTDRMKGPIPESNRPNRVA